MPIRTPLCEMLGIEHPVLNVGFGGGAPPELAAAVSNAGGCGVLGSSYRYPDVNEDHVARLRRLTDQPFGVNVIIGSERNAEVVEQWIDLGVPLLVLFWGDPSRFVERAHRRGIKVFLQIGSVEEAVAAAAVGVDAVIAQGVEAGGHVKGTTSLWSLLPAVVDAVRPIPVLASGGIADGRGLAAAIALGACGVSMGTRFVASTEASIHPAYRDLVVRSRAEDTVYTTDLFNVGWPNAPHRALRTRLHDEWEAAGRPPSGQRPGEGDIIGKITTSGRSVDIVRYSAAMASAHFEGEIDLMPHWAGQSVSLVNDIKPAAAIVHDVIREAEEALERLSAITRGLALT